MTPEEKFREAVERLIGLDRYSYEAMVLKEALEAAFKGQLYQLQLPMGYVLAEVKADYYNGSGLPTHLVAPESMGHLLIGRWNAKLMVEVGPYGLGYPASFTTLPWGGGYGPEKAVEAFNDWYRNQKEACAKP